MSLQAVAGIAYDRRRAAAISRIEPEAATSRPAIAGTIPQPAAKQFNGALEALKRYIPTEFLALYLPFIAIAKDQFKDAAADAWSVGIHIGFLSMTPVAVMLIYIAKAAETGDKAGACKLPYVESVLATVAFAVWGASVPGVFPGNQWWLAMLAMASAFVLPLVDTAVSGRVRE